MRRRALLAMTGLLSFAGCATAVWYGTPTKLNTAQLTVGMTQPQAQALFGLPQSVVSRRMQGMLVETWTYLDRTLTFHNGTLHSWAITRVTP